jgi:hypothetical protein
LKIALSLAMASASHVKAADTTSSGSMNRRDIRIQILLSHR